MSRYRLLVLATRHAIPPDSGYATDVYRSVLELVRLGVDVRVLLVDDGKGHATQYPSHLLAGVVKISRAKRTLAVAHALGTGRAYVACKWSLTAIVRHARELHKHWPFDLVQAIGAFHMVNALAIRRCCPVKVVLRAANVEHLICQRIAESLPYGWRRLLWQCEAVRLRAAEAKWCQAADLCLPISDTDRAVLQSMAPNTTMLTVQAGSNLKAEPANQNSVAIPPCFFHVGSLEWEPRWEGLCWFVRSVWPLVRNALPGARLLVAGYVSDRRRSQLESWAISGVEVLGYVDDLVKLARNCVGMVVPMRCGGGIKIRVLTAWACGWPVVGTSRLGEGLPAQHDVNCLMADDPEALAAALQRLAIDCNLRKRITLAGLRISHDKFSWEVIGQALLAAHEYCLKDQ